ncbi:MAG: lactonase family protein [Lewinellaceae bacterium]|nr:lactonase family protein [Lewinellaceae bacterium]
MPLFYTGSYTQEGAPAANPTGKGIGCFRLDEESGEVERLHYTEQRNPSYLAISEDKKYLYAVEEMYENLQPEVYAYSIGKGGELSWINSQKLAGDYACHLAIIQDRLVVANYVSGNALSFPIQEDGGLAPSHQLIQHTGTGPNEERQEAAHAHMIYPFKEDQMYVVDLGIDKAKAYRFDPETQKWQAMPALDIQIEPGAGARHMVMDGSERYAFVLSELSGHIFVLENQNGRFKHRQKISFVPEDHRGSFGGAAIRMHPNGQFLYASCRGADTLAVFKIEETAKKLERVAFHPSHGKTPRDFNIDPTGKWLITAHQDSDTLTVFEINQKNGKLNLRSTVPVETPVNICWL